MTAALFGPDPAPTITGRAVISPCGQFRYFLERRWEPESTGMGTALMPFVMLNPSTADADQDDPTIRRCMGFARREGAGGIGVVNLGAYRATNPDDWTAAVDPIGPDNTSTVLDFAELAGYIVAAWGAHPAGHLLGRWWLNRFRELGIPVLCLGVTKDGSPRHPLYVRADQPLVTYPGATA